MKESVFGLVSVALLSACASVVDKSRLELREEKLYVTGSNIPGRDNAHQLLHGGGISAADNQQLVA